MRNCMSCQLWPTGLKAVGVMLRTLGSLFLTAVIPRVSHRLVIFPAKVRRFRVALKVRPQRSGRGSRPEGPISQLDTGPATSASSVAFRESKNCSVRAFGPAHS